MKEEIKKIKNNAVEQITNVDTVEGVEEIRVSYLGKKGQINSTQPLRS